MIYKTLIFCGFYSYFNKFVIICKCPAQAGYRNRMLEESSSESMVYGLCCGVFTERFCRRFVFYEHRI